MIDLKTEDGIAILTLAHGRANALDIEFCEALANSFAELRDAPARAVILTGQARMFSAGVDLVRLSSGGPDYIRTFLPSLHRLYEAAFFLPKPVVAAINGHAVAGGAVLACCADRRIMARGSGRIGITELLVGVPFPALAFDIVRFALPQRHLTEFMLGAATYDSDAALQRGWVDEVVEPDALMPRALEAAKQFARLSPAALAQTKMQLRAEIKDRIARSGAATDAIVTDIWAAPEALGSIRDYVARTLKKA